MKEEAKVAAKAPAAAAKDQPKPAATVSPKDKAAAKAPAAAAKPDAKPKEEKKAADAK